MNLHRQFAEAVPGSPGLTLGSLSHPGEGPVSAAPWDTHQDLRANAGRPGLPEFCVYVPESFIYVVVEWKVERDNLRGGPVSRAQVGQAHYAQWLGL